MPNYSHGTKLTLAAADEPPYLTVGTDVSAKYKGAFCEAKIIDVSKHVKVRVLFDGSSGAYLIDDTELKAGSTLDVGAKVEAKHPEKKQQAYVAATITKILDHSRYTVVFDDGDQCILRRSSICLKSGKHFAESETLDQLPLTNPEHFGNPVKVGQTTEQAGNQHNNNINQSNQQAENIKQSSSNNKPDNSTSGSNNNNNNNNKIVISDKNSTTTNGRAAAQSNIKQETSDKPTTKTKTSSSAATLTPGRRGGKGRKARESITDSKHTADMPDDPGDSSQDSADADGGDPNVNNLIEVGVKLMVQYGKGKVQNVYEAKVNKIETNSAGKTRYFVHYTGWNNRYDEWVTKNRILSVVTDKENGARDGRSRHSEVNATNSNASSNATSSNSTTKESNPVKDKDKEVSTPAKGPRRSRLTETSSTASTTPASTSAITTTTTVAPSIVATSGKERDKTKDKDKEREKEREKEKEKDKEKETEAEKEKEREKEKEAPTKTRRSRHIVDSSANSATTSSSASSTCSVVSAVAPVVVKDEPREKEPVVSGTPTAKPGRPRQSDVTHSTPSSISTRDKDKEPPTKTRRSKHVEASTTNPVPATPAAEATAPSSPPRLANNQTERDKKTDTEKGTDQPNTKEDLTTKQPQPELAASDTKSFTHNNRSTSPVAKGKEADKELTSVQSSKHRGSRQSESSIASSTVNPASSTASISSSASSTSSSTTSTMVTPVSEATTPATNSALTTIATTYSATIASSVTVVSVTSLPNRDRERDKERDKEPPTKIRRSRQATSESSVSVAISNAVTSATISTTTTTGLTCTGSPNVANPSIASSASSSSSSSSSITFSNSVMSAYNLIDRERFNDLPIIDEPDCDKRISILQDKIMAIKQTYMALRSELADLDRRKKRPRLERSNQDHINFSGLTCRN